MKWDGAPSSVALPAAGWGVLESAALLEGHLFVKRMRLEWDSGRNRFDRPGEVLLGFHDDAGNLIAFGGINIDPYLNDPSIARLRHLYVQTAHRQHGLGGRLVAALINHARGRFARLRLRTLTPEADALYRKLGFSRSEEPDATHGFML